MMKNLKISCLILCALGLVTASSSLLAVSCQTDTQQMKDQIKNSGVLNVPNPHNIPQCDGVGGMQLSKVYSTGLEPILNRCAGKFQSKKMGQVTCSWAAGKWKSTLCCGKK